MKALHIHIGAPKTATTAIQFFCSENAEVLARKGFCYPIFPFSYPGIAPGHNGRPGVDIRIVHAQRGA